MKYLMLCLCISSLMLNGCNNTNPTDTTSTRSESSHLSHLSAPALSASSQHYQLKVTLPTQGIPVSDYFDLQLDILTALGNALPYPVTLEFHAGMTAHNHGMNTRPHIKQLTNGRFQVQQLLFHMPGEWNIEVRILRGLVSETIKLNLHVTP